MKLHALFACTCAALLAPIACRMQEDGGSLGSGGVAHVAAKPAAAKAAPAAATEGPRFVKAPEGEEVPALVLRQIEAAHAEKRELLVYVGATWCEPCQRFHHAVQEGKLDRAFPRLTLLEFDTDRDNERLRASGYGSRFIPLFALPGPDGRGSGRTVEGSVKGDGAVAEITPRLRDLLAGSAVR